jgi:hypothetical protein
MAQYLIVDDRDGRVIAELGSAEQAARLLSRMRPTIEGAPPLSVVRIDRHSGDFSEVSSVVAMRPLSPPVELS